jgi:hypothetical protein
MLATPIASSAFVSSSTAVFGSASQRETFSLKDGGAARGHGWTPCGRAANLASRALFAVMPIAPANGVVMPANSFPILR